MNKNNKKIFIIIFTLLIYIVTWTLYITNLNSNYKDAINIVFWMLFFIILFLYYGYVPDRNYYKNSTIKLVIIIILMYIFINMLMGLIVGFGYGGYNKNIIQTIRNITPLLIVYPLMEVSKYIIYNKKISKINIVIITLEFIIINVLMLMFNEDISTIGKFFVAFSTIILPTIFNECLYSYITYNVSYIPTLIYKLTLEVLPFLLYLMPSLGNYLISVFGIVLPFITFTVVRKNLLYHDKKTLKFSKLLFACGNITLISFLILLVMLTSGFFKYKLVSIVSNSMQPVYSRGDAVLIKKKNAEDIVIGDILAFNMGNGIITHRVVKISYSNNVYTFTTKGDNNDSNDIFEIHNENVIGTVNYILKYAGYPTVFVNDFFEGS